MHSRREQLALFFAVALPVWIFLCFLLSPSVTRGGDCGELIAASYRLGIAHPSGYPVWCLLGRLFAFLPLGEIAWRYNLFSSLCGAGAAGFIALATYRLSLWQREATELSYAQSIEDSSSLWLARIASVGAALFFVGAYHIGSQFIIAEVYAGAALVGAALFYFLLAWHQDDDLRHLFTLALLSGLSLVVHLSAIFILPWLVIAALWKRGLRPAHLICVLLFGLLGLTPALYLPIRSAHFPPPAATSLDAYFYAPLDWGHPTSLASLKNHLSGAQYRKLLIATDTHTINGKTVTTRHLAQSPSELPKHLATFAQFTFLQFLWGVPLLAVGIYALNRTDKRLFWLLLLIAGGNIAVEINYAVADQTNFFFPAYIVMALWGGLGWFVFLRFLSERSAFLGKIGIVLMAGTALTQWMLFGQNASLRGVTRVRDGAIEQARTLQHLSTQQKRPVSVILPADDLLWAFWYVKYALGMAPNVETPWGRLVNSRQARGKLAPYIAQLQKHGPVCLGVWDAAVDARFPLVMISSSGNICLASNRRLPPAAAPISPVALTNVLVTPGPNGLLTGHFRRAPLWRGFGALPELSSAGTSAFEVDFSVPHSWRPTKQDQVYGHIEVLFAVPGQFGTRGPQTQIKSSSSLPIQQRRLVLPVGARPMQLLRAAVPLAIESPTGIGVYDVWTRLVFPSDKRPPIWTRTDRMRITQK